MAIRMQQRRGTSEQWTLANPVLSEGEIGFEVDNDRFKLGDGVNTWANLPYFLNEDGVSASIENYVAITEKGAVNGVASLDSTGNVPFNQLGNIVDGAPGVLNTLNELAAAIGDDASFLTTISTSIGTKQDKVANVSDTEIGYLDGVTSAIQTQLNAKAATSHTHAQADITNLTADLAAKAPLANPTFTGTVSGVTKAHVGLGNVDNTSDANKPVSTATQTALDAKASLAGATFTGNVVVDADFTVNGTNFSASATSITIEDNMVQLAHQNAANTVDLGLVVAYNDGTAQHAGIVRDVSENTWKLFKGVEAEPATTVAFGEGSLDDLALANLNAASATIGDVSNTELQYLNGVTSGVQGQLDLKAPLANPTFTGTVAGVTKTHVGLGNVDNTSDANKPVSTATQTALDAKAPLANPTFTGTVAGVTKTHVGLGNVDNTSDLNKPVSTATQTALDAKANTSHTQNASTIITTVTDRASAYTILSADENTFIRSTSATAVTMTINNVLNIGESIQFIQFGAGQITFAAGSGVALRSVDNKLKSNKQYSVVAITCVASGEYLVTGDVAA